MSEREKKKDDPVQKGRPQPHGHEPAYESIMHSPARSVLLGRLPSVFKGQIKGAVLLSGDKISMDGSPLGEFRGECLLVHLDRLSMPIPHAIKIIADAKKLVVFCEITQNDVLVCAGNSLGHKLLFLSLIHSA